MQHTALLDLPDVLEGLGLNVIVLDGWDEAQGDYFWTDPHGNGAAGPNQTPFGYMVHHSASASATPVVRTPSGEWSKANAWIGLWRDGRLYQYGEGTPTIVLVAAGPARVSSGYGYRPAAWDYTFIDRRAPWKAEGPDGTTALNRYVVNVEVVCEGRNTALNKGVWEHVVGLGVGLHMMFDWRERTLGHNSWSQRKVDPEWRVGLPNDGRMCIIDVQDAIAAALEGGDMAITVKIGGEYPQWEGVSWRMARSTGADINGNNNSGIINDYLPWKTNVRLVQSEDFDLIAAFCDPPLNAITLDRMRTKGLYLEGIEMNAFEQALAILGN